MKPLLFSLMLLLGSTATFAITPPDVNEKVLKAFNETFKDPQNVAWHEYDDYYEVSFKQEEIKTRVRYDEQGNILGTTRYYSEKELQPHIVARIKSKYPNRSIYGVTELYSENSLEYYITLQDDKHWYTIRSTALGDLEQTEKFKKAPTK
jgi:hypothetical protein